MGGGFGGNFGFEEGAADGEDGLVGKSEDAGLDGGDAVEGNTG